jgi:hypothetical protein
LLREQGDLTVSNAEGDVSPAEKLTDGGGDMILLEDNLSIVGTLDTFQATGQ